MFQRSYGLQGIHEKQSSCLFQAKSAQTIVTNNICFDVPRAGININVMTSLLPLSAS